MMGHASEEGCNRLSSKNAVIGECPHSGVGKRDISVTFFTDCILAVCKIQDSSSGSVIH
jgi:hypothetical protein